MPNAFTHHLDDADETYSEHFVHAASFGVVMLWAGFACMMHAIFPFFFEKTGSDAIRRLYEKMVTNRADLIAQKKVEPGAFTWVI